MVPIILELFGGLAPGATKLLDELARVHGARLHGDAPWYANSFKAFHAQRISVALQCAAAEEILDTIGVDANLESI